MILKTITYHLSQFGFLISPLGLIGAIGIFAFADPLTRLCEMKGWRGNLWTVFGFTLVFFFAVWLGTVFLMAVFALLDMFWGIALQWWILVKNFF